MKFLAATITALALMFVGIMPANAAPAAPINVAIESNSGQGTALGSASLKVTWSAAANAVAYSVSAASTNLATKSGSPSVCVSSICTSIVSDLTGGATYRVKVTSFASDGSTATATEISFQTKSVPAAPSAVSATLASGQVVLTWSANENLGGLPLTGYQITDESGAVSETVLANQTSTTLTSLTIGASYTFLVAATNSLGSSTAAGFDAITISSVPAPPSTPSAAPSGSVIEASWSEPDDNNSAITGYKVYLVDTTGVDIGLPQSTTATFISLQNLVAGTYRVQVTATNANGDSQRSAFSLDATVSGGSVTNSPLFTPNALINMDIGATQNLSIVAPSAGLVTVAVSASPSGACTYLSGVITAVSSGSCTITASVLASGTFAAGETTRNLTVKAPQSLVFAPIEPQSLPGPITLSAVATSGLSVRFTASGACAVSVRTLSFSSVGVCTIVATQPGNVAYSAANPITRSFPVGSSQQGGGTSTAPGGGNSSGTGGPFIPTRPPVIKPLKLSDVVTLSTRLVGVTQVSLSKTKSVATIRIGKSVAVKLLKLAKGTKVTSTLKNSKGQVFALPTKVVTSSRTYVSSAIKPKARGVYTLTITAGKLNRVLVLYVQ